MSIRIKELMETLTQANEAQEAVPAMKAELARLQRALEASQTEATRYKKASEDIGVELADTKAKVSDVGRERDDAQFRALELEEKLGVISKALGSALGLVEPPKASEVKHEEPAKQAEPEAPQADNSTSTPQPSWMTAPAKRAETNDYHDGYSQHGYHDEDRHTAPEVASPPNPTPAGSATDHSPVDSGTSASTPHSSSEGHQSTPEAGSSQPTPAEKPEYLGTRWQDKPQNMSYSEFIRRGGEKPYWM